MSRILFLDDDNQRHDVFMANNAGPGILIVPVFNAPEAIETLRSSERFDFVFLDHDLADVHYGGSYDQAGTGMDVVDFMCSSEFTSDKYPNLVVVHSWNVVRGQAMTSKLSEHGFAVVRVFFEAKRYVR